MEKISLSRSAGEEAVGNTCDTVPLNIPNKINNNTCGRENFSILENLAESESNPKLTKEELRILECATKESES